jgi:hypothetical protein
MARDEHRTHDAAEAVTRSAAATQAAVFHIAKDAARTTQRVGEEIQGIAATGVEAAKTIVPDPETVATLSKVAVGAMTEIGSAWIDWVGQTTRAGTQFSQQILWQALEQQQRFAANAMHGWMDRNANVMRITKQVAQEGFRPFANRTGGSDDPGSTRR